MKKTMAFLLALCLCLSVAPLTLGQTAVAAAPAARTFTDDLDRTLEVPEKIQRVAVTGPLTQIYALPLCIDLLVGYSTSFSEGMDQYIPAEYIDLPELGQLYGGKGTMDLEALLAAAPDVVIDVGEPKGNIVEDLDKLTQQTGIPFLHFDATVETAPQAFRRMGELLDRQEKAEELAVWCENAYSRAVAMMEKIDADGNRSSILYALGDKGLNTLAEKSFHADTLNIMGDNVAKLDDVNSSGRGNEVDLEQIYLWDPAFIVCEFPAGYDTIQSDPAWAELDAVKNGNVFKTPTGPYGWLASPPSVQRYLGLLWLGSLMYPDYVEYDLRTEINAYYRLFYGFEMTDEVYASLMTNAMP